LVNNKIGSPITDKAELSEATELTSENSESDALLFDFDNDLNSSIVFLFDPERLTEGFTIPVFLTSLDASIRCFPFSFIFFRFFAKLLELYISLCKSKLEEILDFVDLAVLSSFKVIISDNIEKLSKILIYNVII
jgi:hypothetical protein